MTSLPSLNRRNWWTTTIFQILLIAHECSGLREQQLVTCRIVEYLEFGAQRGHQANRLQKFSLCHFIFLAYASKCIIITESKIYIQHKSAVLRFLEFSFHEASGLRKHKNSGVVVDEPPQDSAELLVYRSFCYSLPILFKFIRLLF